MTGSSGTRQDDLDDVFSKIFIIFPKVPKNQADTIFGAGEENNNNLGFGRKDAADNNNSRKELICQSLEPILPHSTPFIT